MLLFLHSTLVYRFFSHSLPCPPFCFVSSPSDFPQYHPANLTTLTFSPFFPSCISTCLRLRARVPLLFLFLFLVLSSLSSFLHPYLSSFPSRFCCTTPSSPVLLRRRLSPLTFALLGFPFYSLYRCHPSLFCSHRQPSFLSFFRVHVSFLFLPRFTHLVSSSKRTEDKWLDIRERQHGEKENENKRTLLYGRFLLSSALAAT